LGFFLNAAHSDPSTKQHPIFFATRVYNFFNIHALLSWHWGWNVHP